MYNYILQYCVDLTGTWKVDIHLLQTPVHFQQTVFYFYNPLVNLGF